MSVQRPCRRLGLASSIVKLITPVDSRREAIASRLASNDKQHPLRFQQVSWNFAAILGNLFHNRRVQPNIHGR